MAASRLGIGVFDHLDRGGGPTHQYYEDRLAIAEAYDAAGFDGYFVAEHHGTPLGEAPSPGVFFASVAQRTKRLRFGPMVYLLPYYHPVRLAEEIAMIDQLSRGRYEPGLGLGISPLEARLYAVDHEHFREVFDETVEIVKQALERGRVYHDGTYYQFHDVPMEVHPYQKPSPPFWYGISSYESAQRCAAHGFHAVTLSQPERAKELGRLFRDATVGKPHRWFGISRFVVVGETDDEALAIARRAYPVWWRNFNYLYHRAGRSPVQGERPADFDGMAAIGLAIAGSPATVTAALQQQLADIGADYFMAQLVFGDITREEGLRNTALFANEVVPKLRAALTG
jgi:alkanesulfonate monooxygenase SsuD/methylene tetrahydromethanopterin reductase-like flavin-dependent oxidoreductase (luciferase family)